MLNLVGQRRHDTNSTQRAELWTTFQPHRRAKTRLADSPSREQLLWRSSKALRKHVLALASVKVSMAVTRSSGIGAWSANSPVAATRGRLQQIIAAASAAQELKIVIVRPYEDVASACSSMPCLCQCSVRALSACHRLCMVPDRLCSPVQHPTGLPSLAGQLAILSPPVPGPTASRNFVSRQRLGLHSRSAQHGATLPEQRLFPRAAARTRTP